MGAKRKFRAIIIYSVIFTLCLSLTALFPGVCAAGNSATGNSPKQTAAPSPKGAPTSQDTPASAPVPSSPAVPGSPAQPTPPASSRPITAGGIVYQDTQYGFDFNLPKDWNGYTIISDRWEGRSINGEPKIVESGPIIRIRSPKWTAQNPMQDIPIMVFTIAQWNALQHEEFAVSAAPIGPSELGRNSKYVFALPARYNFSFLTGYEEVEEIMNSKPLRAYDR